MEEPLPTNSTDWIRIFDRSPETALRLVCCPHAGASAGTYRALSGALPAAVQALPVQYPGRRGGPAGPGIDDIGELAERISAELLRADGPLGSPGPPVAVLGHSMGSVVAFEVTRRLEEAGVQPVRLFVSGRRSPSAGLGLDLPRDDAEILAELRELGGIPERLLARPKYRESIMAVIRTDYRANSRYRAPAAALVKTPLTFLFAEDDPYLDPDAALAWRRHTAQDFRLASFPGGHFFLNEQLAAIVTVITADLGIDSTPRGTGGRP
ncbi:thioesterase II family protein [Kitasatospora sp. NBC_00315]|uniref:thioesterase II family protein n=1 Tax=Kitasatospora sp. NBC_00315 TaxID=2975963 RepID=UPI003245F1E4